MEALCENSHNTTGTLEGQFTLKSGTQFEVLRYEFLDFSKFFWVNDNMKIFFFWTAILR